MNAQEEWSRSRYWLCHFLHNRHDRQPIAWSSPLEAKRSCPDSLVHWLKRCAAGRCSTGAWMIDHAARPHKNDPAYVQSLRLYAKERHYHGDLARKLLVRLGQSPASSGGPGLLLSGGRVLGLRFELAALLLADLVDITLLELAGPADDAAARGVCRSILRDKAAHVTFHAERLTMEFADFNFVRRNLRRARLRGIFAAKLTLAVAQDGRLIAASGASRGDFVRNCWRRFEAVLEGMVPYQREALLRALLAQRERPYEKRLVLVADF